MEEATSRRFSETVEERLARLRNLLSSAQESVIKVVVLKYAKIGFLVGERKCLREEMVLIDA